MLPRLFFLLALAVSSAVVLPAQTPMTRLQVEVRSLGDRPIERASVIVNFLEGRSVMKLGKKTKVHWEMRTNQDGIAKIPPVPQGKIRIQVIAKGYQTFGRDYEVEENEKTIEIKLNPPQAPYSSHE